ncbi:putative amidohydrolase [Sulfobacillus acidophilus TPY]|uniref:Amidohydrolase n=1 Tax=Sulfobacillus acidophilus (strain ATCC 700253 / DSM 10332 / NAL) TaxID=679936 RepID=G8TXW3_SULAD|nr:putative amidohydrolase [Sulfobacillus acidophilus TPY]AEW06169.1 amidohydrolase [Sulfobacillus acidophilus DSM 10332]
MWALVNARLWDGQGVSYERGGLLVDDDGRIQAVEGHYQPPAGVPAIDARGAWCLPGLIDAHSHLGITTSGEGPAHQDVNEPTDAVTADLRAIDGVNPRDPAIGEALAAGVTAAFITIGSANVIGGIGSVLHLAGETVESMLMVQAAGMKAALGENPIRIHGGQKRRPASRPGVAAVLREWLERARRYQNDPPLDWKQYDPKLEALGLVIRRDIPLRIHAHRADDILTALRVVAPYKVRTVIDHGTEAHLIIDELKRADVPVVTGPSFAARSKAELRQKGFWTPVALARAGILTAIASDHPVVPAEYLALYAGLAVREGMDPDQALAAVTGNPAKILGIADRVGSLQVGREADIVLWSDNPLTHLTAKAHTVWIAGRPVWERG